MGIRYDQKTERELSRVVKNFNQKISRLEKQERDLLLPEKISKTYIKHNIENRNDLNKMIRSLSRFSRRGYEETYTTMAGEKMSKWERKELGIESRSSQAKLQREIDKLKTKNVSIAGKSVGYSYAQMGNMKIKTLEAQIESAKIEKLEKAKGEELERFKNRVSKYSKGKTKRQLQMFKENYFYMLKNTLYQQDDEKMKELIAKLDTLTGEEFYELYNFDEALKDIPIRYRAKNDDLYDVSSSNYNSEMFELLNNNIEEILKRGKSKKLKNKKKTKK